MRLGTVDFGISQSVRAVNEDFRPAAARHGAGRTYPSRALPLLPFPFTVLPIVKGKEAGRGGVGRPSGGGALNLIS